MKHAQNERQDRKRPATARTDDRDGTELSDAALDALVGGVAGVPTRQTPPATHLNSLDGVV